MGLFSKKLKKGGVIPVNNNEIVIPPKPPTSYIEIYKAKKGTHHIRIKGGNNKIRFHSENYYSKRNARRAAKLFSVETGLKIVDRSK